MEKFAECVQDSEQLKSVLLDMKVPRSNTMLGCEISHSLLVFYDLQNNKIVSIKRNIVDKKSFYVVSASASIFFVQNNPSGRNIAQIISYIFLVCLALFFKAFKGEERRARKGTEKQI